MDDQMVRWPDDQMAGWPEDRMARSPDDWMTRRPDGQKTIWSELWIAMDLDCQKSGWPEV